MVLGIQCWAFSMLAVCYIWLMQKAVLASEHAQDGTLPVLYSVQSFRVCLEALPAGCMPAGIMWCGTCSRCEGGGLLRGEAMRRRLAGLTPSRRGPPPMHSCGTVRGTPWTGFLPPALPLKACMQMCGSQHACFPITLLPVHVHDHGLGCSHRHSTSQSLLRSAHWLHASAARLSVALDLR